MSTFSPLTSILPFVQSSSHCFPEDVQVALVQQHSNSIWRKIKLDIWSWWSLSSSKSKTTNENKCITMIQCLFWWRFKPSSTKMPNGCKHSLLRWWEKCCSVNLLRFMISSKAKRSQSKRRNVEYNQRFGYWEIPSPGHGWTQHELECTWLDKWPSSYQCVSKNIRHWFLFIAYSSWCLPNLNDQTWMGHS